MNHSKGTLEIQVVPQPGFATASGVPVAKAKEAFDALGDLLAESLQPFHQKLAAVQGKADEVELQFGVSLKAEKDWVVVSGEVGATITLTLLWKNP
jgi:hypothetical protein